MNSFWSITLATLAKDIRLEWRSKDALNAMLFFSLLVTLWADWCGWRFCSPRWLR